ncbi:DUF2461 domain-containing protein [Ekhidna sp. To15]|uniref:DUF2461 domain-containing protein n=1 Tax=Ekhidna sp. To15 TaxID=3395267 RepID=UPI003F521A1B
MDLRFTLNFLSDLAKHNKKEWMDDNKKRYKEAKDQVIELVSEIILKSSAFDPSIASVDPRKTLFRINRDIRFSKNKDPYKTNFGAAIVEGGRKSGNPGYYLHIMPDNNFAGGGVYQPSSDMLQKVRQEIDYNGKEVRAIIDDKNFKKTFEEPYGDDKLKTAPKGYPKDHENIDLLQLKHYVFMKKMTDNQVTSNDFASEVSDVYKTLHPFNIFLAKALD